MVSLREHSVRIPAGSAEIEGVLVLPAAPIGLVLFAHGSGSSRFSPRNVHVARALHARGIGTLLLVGSRDTEVLALNRQAASHLRCMHHLSVVRGATHLFEEPGTLDVVAQQAADWFAMHLPSPQDFGG